MEDLKRYYIKTYGCAMNYADSERIRFVLNSVGLEETKDLKKTNLIILNSCSVRKQAEDKIAGWAIKRKRYGLENKVFVLTGCMASRKREHFDEKKYVSKLKKKYFWLNEIIDINEIVNLPERLNLRKFEEKYSSYLNIKPVFENSFVSNIPISTGCNFFCSYCIVPYSRGELFHRDYNEIMNEVELNIANGSKLISLVAQNVNSWSGKRGGKLISFSSLLEDISSLKGDFWINFISSNPMDFTDEMIEVISKKKKIMRWLNIAVQSGSNNILKKMNRRYTIEEFEFLINRIKKQIPDMRLTTDIIVGFPGEEIGDFEKTLDLIKKLQFHMLYVGKYSSREGTVASKMDDSISQKEKKRREDILKYELNIMRKGFHEGLVGGEIDVLVLGGKRGLSYYFHEVVFEDVVEEKLIGKIIKVFVLGSTLSGLIVKV